MPMCLIEYEPLGRKYFGNFDFGKRMADAIPTKAGFPVYLKVWDTSFRQLRLCCAASTTYVIVVSMAYKTTESAVF